jgi:hypothetical protein
MTTDASVVKESLRRLDDAAKSHLAASAGVATDDLTVTAAD